MKTGLVQYAPEWESPVASVEKLKRMLDDVEPVDLLVFPEMTLTGFTMKSACHGDDAMCFFSELARQRAAYVAAGVIEATEGKPFNTLIMWNREGVPVGRYRKIHPFSFAAENDYYAAGTEPVVVPVDDEPFGLSICYDLRFPELYRLYALRGAKVMLTIANWPAKRSGHWLHLLKARAIENQCFMIGVNRVGSDPSNEYNGCSAVFSPSGDELVCVQDTEKVAVVDLDMDWVGQIRSQMPVLKDIKLISE